MFHTRYLVYREIIEREQPDTRPITKVQSQGRGGWDGSRADDTSLT